jgi:hypothetical protein
MADEINQQLRYILNSTISQLMKSEQSAYDEYAAAKAKVEAAAKEYGADLKEVTDGYAEIGWDEAEHFAKLRRLGKKYVDNFDDPKLKKQNAKDSADLFYGIPKIIYIDNGTQNDPYVRFHDRIYDYYDLEDMLWDEYKEDHSAGSVQAKDFVKWVHDNPENAYSALEDLTPLRTIRNVDYGEDTDD